MIFSPDSSRLKSLMFSADCPDAKMEKKRWRDGRNRLGESFFLPNLCRVLDLLPGYSSQGDNVVSCSMRGSGPVTDIGQ